MKVETGSYTPGTATTGAALTDSVKATGSITFNGQPSAGDTITVGGTIFTFRLTSTHPLAYEAAPRSFPGRFGHYEQSRFLDVKIGDTRDHTRENFVAASKRVSAVREVVTIAIGSGAGAVNITHSVCSTAGNAYTLAKFGANIAINGNNLSGGVNQGTGRYTPSPAFIAVAGGSSTVCVPDDDEVGGQGGRESGCISQTSVTMTLVIGQVYHMITCGCSTTVVPLR